MELRAKGFDKFEGPSDPDALRLEIASRVFEQVVNEDLNAEQITQRVLSSFGIEINAKRADSARTKDQ
jgi:hypothetical protein